MVFIASCNGFVRALDRRTGEAVWTYDTRLDGDPVEFHGDPVVTEDLVVLGSDLRSPDGKGRIYAFEQVSGLPRWIHPAGHGVATDLRAVGDTIFAVSLADEILALRLSSGDLLWRFATGIPNADLLLNSSPAASPGRVFFGSLDGTLHALDVETGATMWKRSLGSRISTSVLLAGGFLYAGTSDGRLHRLEPSSGEVISSLNTEEPPRERLSAAGGCLLAFLGERTIECVELSLETVRWKQSNPKDWTSSRPYAWKDFVLAGDGSGVLVAIRLSDGNRAWSETVEGMIRGIGIAQDTFYVGTLKGKVHALQAPALDTAK